MLPLGHIFVIVFLGFVTGVLVVALGKDNFLLNDGILNSEFLMKMQDINVDKRSLFFLCLGERLRAFILMVLLAYSTINVFYCNLYFALQGFYIGSVMELLAIRYGGYGMFLYLGMIFPHGIFYGLGFLCLGCWCLQLEKTSETGIRRKVEKLRDNSNRIKVWIALGFILVGVILESYVNLGIFCKIL